MLRCQKMNKIKIKTIVRTEGILGAGKSNTAFVSKEGTYDVLADSKLAAINSTPEEKIHENSRMFFLNAMNQYENKLNREFNE
jgi:hypothetical protein